MADVGQGAGWWIASDGKWYPSGTAPARNMAIAIPIPPLLVAPTNV